MIDLRPDDQGRIVVFALDGARCALSLSVVERAVRAVAVTSLPKAPEIVLGVINVRGNIIPVVDVRKRFRYQAREMNVDDRFIIAHTNRRTVALVVDAVLGVRELAAGQLASARRELPFASHLEGVARMEDGLVMIYDLDRFLSLDEESALDAALSERTE